jgi:hypothetical protein
MSKENFARKCGKYTCQERKFCNIKMREINMSKENFAIRKCGKYTCRKRILQEPNARNKYIPIYPERESCNKEMRECDPDIRSLYIFYWRTVSCWSLTGISNFGQILLLPGTNFVLSQTFKKKHNGACYVPSGLFLEER